MAGADSSEFSSASRAETSGWNRGCEAIQGVCFHEVPERLKNRFMNKSDDYALRFAIQENCDDISCRREQKCRQTVAKQLPELIC